MTSLGTARNVGGMLPGVAIDERTVGLSFVYRVVSCSHVELLFRPATRCYETPDDLRLAHWSH
jgi:hypothetical protein